MGEPIESTLHECLEAKCGRHLLAALRELRISANSYQTKYKESFLSDHRLNISIRPHLDAIPVNISQTHSSNHKTPQTLLFFQLLSAIFIRQNDQPTLTRKSRIQ